MGMSVIGPRSSGRNGMASQPCSRAALVTFAYTVGVPTGGVQASNCKLAVSAFFAEQ